MSVGAAWLVAGGLTTYFGVGLVASHGTGVHLAWLAAAPAGWLAFSQWAIPASDK